jgi:hypothetical protein
MNQGTVATKSSKTQYSEQEAASELGITVPELRALVRNHIAESDEDLNNMSITSFHPSDLLVLKLLAGVKGSPTPGDSEA